MQNRQPLVQHSWGLGKVSEEVKRCERVWWRGIVLRHWTECECTLAHFTFLLLIIPPAPLPVGGGATGGAWKGFAAGAPGPPCGYPDPKGAYEPEAMAEVGGLCKPPAYMGTGAPVCEVGGIGPEGREVGGRKLVGGTPGLGIGGMHPGVDDIAGSGGPDRLAAGMGGPGGGKAAGPLIDMGGGWNG